MMRSVGMIKEPEIPMYRVLTGKDGKESSTHPTEPTSDVGGQSFRRAITALESAQRKDEDSPRNLSDWRRGAKAFLTTLADDEQPLAVPLKGPAPERPSSTEEKLRTQVELNYNNQRRKEQEERFKKQELLNQRRMGNTKAGTMTYDFEGRVIAIKPGPGQIKNDPITVNIPSSYETLNPSLTNKGRRQDLPAYLNEETLEVAPNQLPNFTAEVPITFTKLDTVKTNPFELFNPSQGVKGKYATKEKENSLKYKYRRMPNGAMRMSKEDYQEFIERTADQNTDNAMKEFYHLERSAPVVQKAGGTKGLEDESAHLEKSQPVAAEGEPGAKRFKFLMPKLTVKNPSQVAELFVMDNPSKLLKPSFSSEITRKVDQKRLVFEKQTRPSLLDKAGFNAEILRGMKASEVQPRGEEIRLRPPPVNPARKHHLEKSMPIHNHMSLPTLGRNLPLKFEQHTVKPRDKQLFHNSKPRLEPLAPPNIFERPFPMQF